MVHRDTFDDMVQQRNRAKNTVRSLSSELNASLSEGRLLREAAMEKDKIIGDLTTNISRQEESLRSVESDYKNK